MHALCLVAAGLQLAAAAPWPAQAQPASGLTGAGAKAAAAALPAFTPAPAWTGSLSPQAQAERAALLAQAEQLLAGGQAEAAHTVLQRAALMQHAADTEAALVRAQMQAGDYRQALAFAAHAAGSHRELPASHALYLWLLHLGGQGAVAERGLAEALAAQPDQPALRATQAAWASGWPRPDAVLRSGPARAAPHAWGDALPAGARSAGTAVLLPGGRQALVPVNLLPAGSGDAPWAGALWLRNGLGQTVAARLLRQDNTLGVALLGLATPLPALPLAAAGRPPFAGSPGALVEYGAAADAEPAWPVLRQGFFGRLPLRGPGQTLGIDAPPGPRGGPVFDAAGRWAGLALARPGSSDQLLDTASLQAFAGDAWPSAATPLPVAAATAPPERMPLDAVYELGLRHALQVLLPQR